jgi:hypothetical protein
MRDSALPTSKLFLTASASQSHVSAFRRLHRRVSTAIDLERAQSAGMGKDESANQKKKRLSRTMVDEPPIHSFKHLPLQQSSVSARCERTWRRANFKSVDCKMMVRETSGKEYRTAVVLLVILFRNSRRFPANSLPCDVSSFLGLQSILGSKGHDWRATVARLEFLTTFRTPTENGFAFEAGLVESEHFLCSD